MEGIPTGSETAHTYFRMPEDELAEVGKAPPEG